MLEKTNSKIFTFLLGLSALLVAAAAAIFSVTGLSMLYSGEMLYVAIAMGVLEFAKIITASYLYRYWKTTGWGLKIYLSIAVLVLMIVTSGGIYGYLTNSYQGATIGLDRINSQTMVLEQRKENYTDERDRLKLDLESLRSERRSILDSRAAEIKTNDESTDSLAIKYRSYRNRKVREQYKPELDNIDVQIAKYMVDLDSTNVRLSNANDNIANQKLELIDTGVDVGPLVYMARIFNTTMDNIMKWFTLVIVFVFDPLAIALIVAYNSVIMKGKREKEYDVGVDPALPGDYSVTHYEYPDAKVTPIIPDAKPVEKAFDDIQKKIDEEKPVLSPELTKKLDDLVGDIKEKPTKDIVVPLEPGIVDVEIEGVSPIHAQYRPELLDEDFSEALNETTKKVGEDEPTKERIVLEPAKSGDIPKEKIKEAVKTVKEKRVEHQNEFFDKMRDEKPDPTIEPPKFDLVQEAYVTKKDEKDFEEDVKKNKTIVSADDIRNFFDDAIRKVKKEGQGKITRTPFQAGGSVNIGHMEDDPDTTDYSIQE